jgi:LysM repeat protein
VVLHPTDTIKIPPVTGLAYTVSPGDTIDGLAEKYKVPVAKIAEQNKLALKQELLIGQQLLIPGAIKISPPKVIPPTIAKKEDPKKKLFVKAPTKKAVYKTYATGFTGKGSRFAWGNCTYFVANHKNVTWHGNANAWLRNAANAGVPTGSNPSPGAIISFQ